MMHHDTLQSMQVSHAYPSVVTVIPAEHPSRNGMPAASQQGVADKACHRAYVSFLAKMTWLRVTWLSYWESIQET